MLSIPSSNTTTLSKVQTRSGSQQALVTSLYFILQTAHTKHFAKVFMDIFAFNSYPYKASTILTPILQMEKLRFQHDM